MPLACSEAEDLISQTRGGPNRSGGSFLLSGRTEQEKKLTKQVFTRIWAASSRLPGGKIEDVFWLLLCCKTGAEITLLCVFFKKTLY
jgi:hypothetical protein